MRNQITSFLIILFMSSTLLATDYPKIMQQGLEMLNKANNIQQAIDAANYFERVAGANKTEWLPLYYAAYACLKAGYQQEKSDDKDAWYEKGIAYTEQAIQLKDNESELLAMKAYLQLMYIANSPMSRAPFQTSGAIELLERSKKLDPSNPRPWLIHGQNTLFTPEFFGGGAKNAKPLLEKAVTLFQNFNAMDSLMPAWGKERCEKLLEKCKAESKS